MLMISGQIDQTTAPQEVAEAVALVYASDTEPGIRRRRAGSGFSYRDHRGRTVSDPATLDRIRALVIPPAWTDVWIAPSDDAHIQATGRDVKGRKQYRYHERWALCRDEVKYSSLTAFARMLPKIRGRVDADLRLRGLPRDKVVASVVWLLDNVLIRVGNADYARQNRSFGLTTLRDRHVEISGSRLRFNFRGKSGKEWRLTIADRRIARVVKSAQDLPGQHLFQYVDDEGGRRAVASQDVNAYLRASGDFTSKHFRTWAATVLAVRELVASPLPASKRETEKVLNAAVDRVAARLGNTRAVCRKCYVHPAVFAAWRDGALEAQFRGIARGVRGRKNMSRDEAMVLKWLESRESAQEKLIA